jgi:hypothetical protein
VQTSSLTLQEKQTLGVFRTESCSEYFKLNEWKQEDAGKSYLMSSQTFTKYYDDDPNKDDMGEEYSMHGSMYNLQRSVLEDSIKDTT